MNRSEWQNSLLLLYLQISVSAIFCFIFSFFFFFFLYSESELCWKRNTVWQPGSSIWNHAFYVFLHFCWLSSHHFFLLFSIKLKFQCLKHRICTVLGLTIVLFPKSIPRTHRQSYRRTNVCGYSLLCYYSWKRVGNN